MGSKILKLPYDVRKQVDYDLAQGASLRKIASSLKKRGHDVTYGSVYRYKQRRPTHEEILNLNEPLDFSVSFTDWRLKNASLLYSSKTPGYVRNAIRLFRYGEHDNLLRRFLERYPKVTKRYIDLRVTEKDYLRLRPQSKTLRLTEKDYRGLKQLERHCGHLE